MSFLDYFKFTRSSNRYYALDALRALAIVLVVYHHALILVPFQELPAQVLSSLPMKVILYFAQMSWIGVDLFFVLSGFLIGSQLLNFFDSSESRDDLWRFFVHRAFRIFPAYYTLLILIQFVFVHLPIFKDSFKFGNIPYLMFSHYLFLQDYTGSFIYEILWSLGVEEKFYLITPFLLWFLFSLIHKHRSRQHTLSLLLFLALLSIPIISRFVFFSSDPARGAELYRICHLSFLHLRCDGLLIGLLTAYIAKYFKHTAWMSHPKTPLVLLLSGTIFTWVNSFFLPSAYENSFSVFNMVTSGLFVAIGFGLMVLGGALLPNQKAGILGNRGLFFIATISYSLYLMHNMFMLPVLMAWMPFSHKLNWPLEVQLSAYVVIFFSVCIFIATLYYLVVEKPFLILKDRIGFTKIKPSIEQT